MNTLRNLTFLTLASAIVWSCNGKTTDGEKDEPVLEQTSYEYPFLNPGLSTDERIENILAQLTVEEKIAQLLHDAAAIERLSIPAYNWWNEALHGVAMAGKQLFSYKPLVWELCFSARIAKLLTY